MFNQTAWVVLPLVLAGVLALFGILAILFLVEV